jgi:hypothetical protein
MHTSTRLAAVALFATVLLHAGRAWAPFHIVAIDQVFFGTAECPNAQYVMLRSLQTGMSFVAGQRIRTQAADGGDAGDFGTFANNLPNGANGAAMIMGTADAAALFGIDMDQEASGQLVFEDGRVCFGDFGGPVDCVAYGDYTGDNGNAGSPAVAPVRGMALIRQGNTNNDQADFALGTASPRNNAGDAGVIGQCQGTGATPTPTPTTGTVSACVGDCNDNEMVQINELILGVNIALDNDDIDACPAFDCQHNGMVPINCLIQGVNNALGGCPEVAAPTRTPGGPLGVRRFSLDPQESQFVAVLGPGASFPSTGFEGFLELSAGVPTNGLAFIELTDASAEPGAVLEGEIDGEPFSCDAWDQEDGPGTLVLSATNLDTPISPGLLADTVVQFRFVD